MKENLIAVAITIVFLSGLIFASYKIGHRNGYDEGYSDYDTCFRNVLDKQEEVIRKLRTPNMPYATP